MKHRNVYKNVDISGERFGRLVALEKKPNSKSTWIFKCDCGNIVELRISKVLYGQLSCGCLRKEVRLEWVKSHTKHGDSKTKLYRKYRSMIERCYHADSWKYKRYGGRGIYICDEWLNSFSEFKKWAYENGYDPELDGNTEQSLDRIDNNGPYSPDNCRWTTPYEQQRNRECTVLYPYKGNMYTISEFADKYGITDKSFVYRRVQVKHQTLEYILNDWNRIHNVPDHLIEVSEVAQKMNVTKAHVRRLINAGKIQGEKVGRKWYVARDT